MRLTSFLLCGALAGGLLAGTVVARPDETVTRRIPQFENEQVRVWKTIIMPGQPLTYHRHDHPRVLVALQGGEITILTEDGEANAHVWETGRAYWLDADPPDELHADVNDGDRPIEVMVVELRR